MNERLCQNVQYIECPLSEYVGSGCYGLDNRRVIKKEKGKSV